MMRWKWKMRGFQAVRKDSGVQADLMRRAGAIAEAAGGKGDFIAVSNVAKGRARAAVIAATEKAQKAEAESRALTNALDAGR